MPVVFCMMVEDTDATLDDLERGFGHDVRIIVDRVTKLGRLSTNHSRNNCENHRKMLMAMSEDIRVILVVIGPFAQYADSQTPSKKRTSKSVSPRETTWKFIPQ